MASIANARESRNPLRVQPKAVAERPVVGANHQSTDSPLAPAFDYARCRRQYAAWRLRTLTRNAAQSKAPSVLERAPPPASAAGAPKSSVQAGCTSVRPDPSVRADTLAMGAADATAICVQEKPGASARELEEQVQALKRELHDLRSRQDSIDRDTATTLTEIHGSLREIVICLQTLDRRTTEQEFRDSKATASASATA